MTEALRKKLSEEWTRTRHYLDVMEEHPLAATNPAERMLIHVMRNQLVTFELLDALLDDVERANTF